MVNFFRSLRIALTIFILFLVWKNSHWSVASSLTLISFSIEGLAAALKVHGDIIKKIVAGPKKMDMTPGDTIFQSNDDKNEEA